MTDLENITFKNIKNTNDVISLNKTLRERKASEEICYVATEIAQNIVNANTKAEMKVNCNSVESIVTGNKYNEASIYTKLAKYAYNKKEYVDLKNENLAVSSGTGLLTIFYSGWDISVNPINDKQYSIIASKK